MAVNVLEQHCRQHENNGDAQTNDKGVGNQCSG